MSDGKIKTVQDDVGFPFRIDTSDVAYVSSWTRPSNDVMVNKVDEMKVIEMSRNQILRAGYRSDLLNGQPRLCLSCLIAGMFASAFSFDKTAPLIVDLVPGIDRKKGSFNEDFCEENGNVSIIPCMPLAKERMKYILYHYSKIFTEGKMYGMDFWIAFVRRGILSRFSMMKILTCSMLNTTACAGDPEVQKCSEQSLCNIETLVNHSYCTTAGKYPPQSAG